MKDIEGGYELNFPNSKIMQWSTATDMGGGIKGLKQQKRGVFPILKK